MVYEYQKKTIRELKNCIDNLEKMTEKEYFLKIGFIRSGSDYFGITIWNPIRIILNRKNYFYEYDSDDNKIEFSYDDFQDDDYIDFDDDLFLKFNKLIDKILEDKKEKEAFHQKLNRELEALNKSL